VTALILVRFYIATSVSISNAIDLVLRNPTGWFLSPIVPPEYDLVNG